jgi:hypothetical protein
VHIISVNVRVLLVVPQVETWFCLLLEFVMRVSDTLKDIKNARFKQSRRTGSYGAPDGGEATAGPGKGGQEIDCMESNALKDRASYTRGSRCC